MYEMWRDDSVGMEKGSSEGQSLIEEVKFVNFNR